MAKSGRVLIVDDDEGVRTILERILVGQGYEVASAGDAFKALDAIDEHDPDAVLLDLKMPGLDGLGLLENIQQRGLELPVVVLTGHGDEFTARDCLESGAVAFMEKPPDRDELLLEVGAAVERGRLQRSVAKTDEPPPLLGRAAAITELKEQIARVAATRATVLVIGASGTGKELVSRRLHHLSSRARAPFVRVNCAAIPADLIESELFGHEKGAFTGADRKRLGKFAAADTGTIFLDEIGDMSLATQAKVLRALNDGEIEPVGGRTPLQVDVRVIAATNKDLSAEVEAGRFREDLYYRLAVVILRTPPLAARREDIPALVEHFSAAYCQAYNRKPKTWSPSALEQLAGYAWPGNVRELRNLVERVVIMRLDDTIETIELPGQSAPAERAGTLEGLFDQPLADFQRASEEIYIRHHLEANAFNVAATARAINTPRSNLYKKIDAYGIRREDE